MNAMKLAIPLLAALAYGPSQGLAAPILGPELASFAVLGASTVTNTGPTIITGNLGLSPGPSVTGFALSNTVVNGPGSTGLIAGPGLVSGTIYIDGALAALAQSQLATAESNLGALLGATAEPAALGGLTLNPGVYSFLSGANLTGILTLNGLGNPNATWVFQIPGSTLTTASGSQVNMINSGSGANVYWNVGSSATLGTNSLFEGNILANTSITLTTGATIGLGRALAHIGAVTMDTNHIFSPVPEPETYAMLLAGFGVVGFAARRRRQKSVAA